MTVLTVLHYMGTELRGRTFYYADGYVAVEGTYRHAHHELRHALTTLGWTAARAARLVT